ncbi:MAG: hypothetical protein AAF004_05980 [Pseudomonadota bacterium]
MLEKLQGSWKSDAERTLASMRSVTGVSARARKMFENDFFGHLIVDYRGETRRMVLDDEDYDTGFTPFEIVDERDESVVLRAWDPMWEDFMLQEIFFEGDAYYVLTGKPLFREYFCRVDQEI